MQKKRNELMRVMDEFNIDYKLGSYLLGIKPRSMKTMRCPSYKTKRKTLDEKIDLLLTNYIDWSHRIITNVELYLQKKRKAQNEKNQK